MTTVKAVVTDITSTEQFNKLVARDCYTIVKFTATWCGPCKQIAPAFESLASEHFVKDCVEFVCVDVDVCSDVTASCGVTAMPSWQAWKSGKAVYFATGANEETLRRLVGNVAAGRIED